MARRSPTTPLALVRAALLAYRTKDGHYPQCFHRLVLQGNESHEPGVECPAEFPCGGINGPMPAAGGGDRQPIPGVGLGCSARCLAAQVAVALSEGV